MGNSDGSYLDKVLCKLLQSFLNRVYKPIFLIPWLYFVLSLDDSNTKCFSVLFVYLEELISLSSTFTFSIQKSTCIFYRRSALASQEELCSMYLSIE
jgi:hypothetical protein